MIEIGESKIEGQGVIATEEIDPKTVIGFVTWPYIAGRHQAFRSLTQMGKKINHSYEPNAMLEKTQVGPGMFVYRLVATERIHPKEEVTVNYNGHEPDFAGAEPHYK